MKVDITENKYIVFLRGINVGGHHKVPMAELRKEMKKLGFENITTLLNSGNIIIETTKIPTSDTISDHLEERFGFPIPVVIVEAKTMKELIRSNPFRNEKVTKDTRLYVSFMWNDPDPDIDLPWHAQDDSFKIIEKRDGMIISVLDLTASKTTKAMSVLEEFYGKEMTTRNWKTIERIGKKLQ